MNIYTHDEDMYNNTQPLYILSRMFKDLNQTEYVILKRRTLNCDKYEHQCYIFFER